MATSRETRTVFLTLVRETVKTTAGRRRVITTIFLAGQIAEGYTTVRTADFVRSVGHQLGTSSRPERGRTQKGRGSTSVCT